MCACVCLKNDNNSICIHLIVIGKKCQGGEGIDPDYSCKDHLSEKDGNLSSIYSLKQESMC